MNLRPLPRLYPHAAPVASIGYLPEKTGWVEFAFKTFNFSFILSGRGSYRSDGGETFAVRAPCVLTQWPGVPFEYGPEGGAWEELYVIYEPPAGERLRAAGLFRGDRPAWYVNDHAPVRRRIEELFEALDGIESRGRADRIDRICDAMALDSLIGRSRAFVDEKEKTIREIRSWMESNYRGRVDLDELALSNGFSPAGFRRHWARFFETPPAKYLRTLKMRQACRMLAETALPVGEIAASLGFDDRLYFSKRFRQATGITASEYRRRHGWTLSMIGDDRESRP